MVKCNCWLKIYCIPQDPVAANEIYFILNEKGVPSEYIDKTNLLVINLKCSLLTIFQSLLKEKCVERKYMLESKCWGKEFLKKQTEQVYFYSAEKIIIFIRKSKSGIKINLLDTEKLPAFLFEKIKEKKIEQSMIGQRMFLLDDDKVMLAVDVLKRFLKRELSASFID